MTADAIVFSDAPITAVASAQRGIGQKVCAVVLPRDNIWSEAGYFTIILALMQITLKSIIQ
jgi:hypothetical protein